MESKIMFEIAKRIQNGEKVALVTLIQVDGSSPGKKGNIMGVFEDTTTMGTVGGGNLEYRLIKEAQIALENQESIELEFNLVDEEALHMKCGGSVKAFIKIFKEKEEIVIIGGGHVGTEIYKLAIFLEMKAIIFDDREEFCSYERFPHAEKLIVGNIKENIKKYNFNKNTYVIIVSRGHVLDKDALSEIINKDVRYIGMIGSRKKIRDTYKNLMNQGIPSELLEKVYSPIGLDISSGSPKEIAFSIVAEILKVKNNLTGKNMKELKKVIF